MKIEKVCYEIHQILSELPYCYGPMDVLSEDGIYFFYEEGETTEHSPDRMKIVRIGTHRTEGRLKVRIKLHYSGDKNSSVFRRLLGGAMMRKENPENPCLEHWEKQDAKTCPLCKPVEKRVSEYLRDKLRFRYVEVKEKELRMRLEEGLIATVSQCPICQPSSNWLGKYAYAPEVRKSGLWVIKGVDKKPLTEEELEIFRNLVRYS